MSSGIDPWQILQDHTQELRNISKTLGGFGEALRQGHEVHKETAKAIRLQADWNGALNARVQAIERHLKSGHKEAKAMPKLGGLTELVKEAKEFVKAVASLKELALAVAIIVAAGAVVSHPMEIKELIDTYNASGQKERE